jgi:hypothetical protein
MYSQVKNCAVIETTKSGADGACRERSRLLAAGESNGSQRTLMIVTFDRVFC